MQRTCYATDFFCVPSWSSIVSVLFRPFLVMTSSGHSLSSRSSLDDMVSDVFLPIMVHVRDGYSCASGFLGSFVGLLFSDTPFGCIEPGVWWFLIFFFFFFFFFPPGCAFLSGVCWLKMV